MKIEDACKTAGCKNTMYCFGGKDNTLDYPLCSTAIRFLWNSLIDAGKVSRIDQKLMQSILNP